MLGLFRPPEESIGLPILTYISSPFSVVLNFSSEFVCLLFIERDTSTVDILFNKFITCNVQRNVCAVYFSL
jgi:hypothetical protein